MPRPQLTLLSERKGFTHSAQAAGRQPGAAYPAGSGVRMDAVSAVGKYAAAGNSAGNPQCTDIS
jgi:hypothetical protein